MFPKPAGIPSEPGCYLFKNALGTVIYVGKAKSLRQRLSNYFQGAQALDVKTRALMEEARSVEWIVAPTEVDALILENELIKANQPRYNMRLKDDKTYPFVAIDARQEFPTAFVTRGQHYKGVRYFGPFVDVRSLRTTMDELIQVYPLRSCTSNKFDFHRKMERPCLLYDIKKCSGPCVGKVTVDGYQELVNAWSRFFEGDVRQLKKILQEQMTTAASLRHYEAAAKARDGLAALERAASHQSVILDDHSMMDVVEVASQGSRGALVRFKIRHGRIVGRTTHLIDKSFDEAPSVVWESLLPDMYPNAGDVPPVIVTSLDVAASDWAEDFLGQRRGRKVRVHVPHHGGRKRMLDMAARDAQSILNRDSLRRQADHNVRSQALLELATALKLPEPPYRVECFDMSHLQGTNYVGSMVVFEDGLPVKSEYRHFNVKEILGNDDVGAMREVVSRRLRYWNDSSEGSKFRRANLIIIDGGLPQLHAAEQAAAAVGIEDGLHLVALAKREELLYRPGVDQPIALPRGSEALYLVQRIRDEAHRFAITFHRSKRGKAMVTGVLEGVRGLGPKRRERLLAHFATLDNIRGASLDDLLAISWLPPEVAQSIYDRVRAPVAPPLQRRNRRND